MALTEAQRFRIEQVLARDSQGQPANAKLRHALEVDRYARALLRGQRPAPPVTPAPPTPTGPPGR